MKVCPFCKKELREGLYDRFLYCDNCSSIPAMYYFREYLRKRKCPNIIRIGDIDGCKINNKEFYPGKCYRGDEWISCYERCD